MRKLMHNVVVVMNFKMAAAAIFDFVGSEF